MDTMRNRTKERHVSIRVSDREAQLLERVAAANKLGVATWVRRAALLAAEREDPETRRERALAAIAAVEEGMTPAQARKMRRALERSE